MKKRVFYLFLLFMFAVSLMIGTGKVAASTQAETVPGFLDKFPYQAQLGYLITKNMPVMVFPLTGDNFYQYWVDRKAGISSVVRGYELDGVGIGYSGLYLAPDPDNPPKGMLRYTVFYRTTGTPLMAIGVYDRGFIDSHGKYQPTTRYYQQDLVGNVENHSVLGDYYPNKIINDLVAARAIMEYQVEHGPFLAGQEYSLGEVFDLAKNDGYVTGLNSMRGGGVCVLATNWMKMVVLNGGKVVERWQHTTRLKYFENPLSGSELGTEATDTTIEWSVYDFKWVQKTTGYMLVNAAVLTDGSFSDSALGNEQQQSDALVLISFLFAPQGRSSLGAQIAQVKSVETGYRAFRAAHVPSADPIYGNSRLMWEKTWSRNDSLSLLLQQIVPEERISRFENELLTDPLLVSLVDLRNEVNSLDPKGRVLVGNFLRRTPWYAQELARLGNTPEAISKLDVALSGLNYYSNTWPGQKVQCVGLIVLLSVMDPRIYNIGGIDFVNAADLIPKEIKNGSMIWMHPGNYEVRRVTSIDEVQIGDVGDRYSDGVGHIFAVVGKKTYEGQTVLLVVSANQTGEGVMSIFEVDNSNFDVVFGMPAYYKVVIRK